MDPAAEVRDATRVYGGHPVVEVDHLALTRGTATALIGPNGSGKSTLLRLLACLEPPTTGVISIAGRPIRSGRDRRWARRRVSLVEQRPLLLGRTVHDAVAYGLALRGMAATDRRDRAAAVMADLGLTGLARRPTAALSEGEAQWAAVARALALEPEVLLLDEPTSAADRATTLRLFAALKAGMERGLTICFASHDLQQAYRWSDRIVSLQQGRPGPVTPENLFRVDLPPGSGARNVSLGPLSIHVVTDLSGPATLAISPDDITLSRTPPTDSSARNRLTGRIVRLSEERPGQITVGIDVGIELTARITPQSATDLDLSVGSPVAVTFKATAVRVV